MARGWCGMWEVGGFRFNLLEQNNIKKISLTKKSFIKVSNVFQRFFGLTKCEYGLLGGALKPTDVEGLWVHVTCAWFRPEVAFLNDEKMEPAVGILRIPSTSFLKVKFF